MAGSECPVALPPRLAEAALLELARNAAVRSSSAWAPCGPTRSCSHRLALSRQALGDAPGGSWALAGWGVPPVRG